MRRTVARKLIQSLLYTAVLLPTLAIAAPEQNHSTQAYPAYQRDDYARAKQYYELAAKQENANAQHALGLMYYHGQGVTQDYVRTKEWIELAARQKHAGAQHALGFMYHNGNGVAQDHNRAKEWFELAAKQGHVDAIEALKIWQ